VMLQNVSMAKGNAVVAAIVLSLAAFLFVLSYGLWRLRKAALAASEYGTTASGKLRALSCTPPLPVPRLTHARYGLDLESSGDLGFIGRRSPGRPRRAIRRHGKRENLAMTGTRRTARAPSDGAPATGEMCLGRPQEGSETLDRLLLVHPTPIIDSPVGIAGLSYFSTYRICRVQAAALLACHGGKVHASGEFLRYATFSYSYSGQDRTSTWVSD
jgi:hypothetical protein